MSRSRCLACGAAVRDGAPWCLLCHSDLRPPPECEPEPVDGPIDGPVNKPVDRGSDQLTAALVAGSAGAVAPPTQARHAAEPGPESEARWPCTGCGADNALDATACATCGTGFLAGLHAADSASLTLPVVGDVGRLSRNARLVLAVGLGLVVALLLTGLVLLIGTLL